MYDNFHSSICALITCCLNMIFASLQSMHVWHHHLQCSHNTIMFQFYTPVYVYMQDCMYKSLQWKHVWYQGVYWVVTWYVLGGVYEPHKWLGVSHLFGGVDCGTCLEKHPHHTEMTASGCHHQRSRPILWSSEGGESKICTAVSWMIYHSTQATCHFILKIRSLCFWTLLLKV